MELGAIISEIETIRLNDYQVCEKISLLEAQIDRLKYRYHHIASNVDGANWFHIEMQNMQLREHCERIQSRSEKILLQFDGELQKLREEYDRRHHLLLQQSVLHQFEMKIKEANECLSSKRVQLEASRQQQAELSKAIESAAHQIESNQTETATLQDLLSSAKSFGRVSNRLHIHQNQLHALERRITNLRSSKTIQPQRETNATPDSIRKHPPRPLSVNLAAVATNAAVAAVPKSAYLSGSSSTKADSATSRSSGLSGADFEPPATNTRPLGNPVVPCRAGPRRDWNDDFTFVDRIMMGYPEPVDEREANRSRSSKFDDDDVIYLD